MKRNLAVLGAAFVALAAGVGIVFSGAAGGAPGDPEASISVDFRAAQPESEQCASREAGLSMTKETSAEAYSFVFTVSSDLCSPVRAKAAAYAMPDNRSWPWPQSLVTVEEFTLQDAGVTRVTFTKACDPIQFDVLTGATPQQIDPFGAVHGPLVVAHTDQFNTNGSAYQYWPPAGSCTDNTSSSSTSSSTTSSSTPGEVPVTVEPATTLPTSGGPGGTDVGDGAGSAQPGATVGGVTATQSPAALAITG